MKPLLKKQEELRAYYYNFPDIEELTNRNRSSIQKAEQFTKSILSELPSGNVSERSTACHVLYHLLREQNSECLFFDSAQGMNLHDASGNLNDLNFKDRPFVLKLNNSDGLGNQKYKNDEEYNLRLIKTLGGMIERNEPHPILEDVQDRLSKAHRTNKENIYITSVFDGSFNVVYIVLEGMHNDLKSLSELPKRLKDMFEQYSMAKIHPLLCRPAFDVSMFDEKGNKTFSNAHETHAVGPPGRTQTYISPAGWTRYGLKVLGKYIDGDRWLHPFGSPENWYRAFHGTGRASADDFNKSKQSFDQQYASVDAMGSIYKTGFRKARVAAYGAGVYCSPDPTFPERGYVGEVEINTQQGKKKFRSMMQVAVNPDGVQFTSDQKIWVVAEPEDIRPYGILIKEI